PASAGKLHLFASFKYLRNTFVKTIFCVAGAIFAGVDSSSTRKSKSTWRSFCSAGFCATAREIRARQKIIVFMGVGSFVRLVPFRGCSYYLLTLRRSQKKC